MAEDDVLENRRAHAHQVWDQLVQLATLVRHRRLLTCGAVYQLRSSTARLSQLVPLASFVLITPSRVLNVDVFLVWVTCSDLDGTVRVRWYTHKGSESDKKRRYLRRRSFRFTGRQPCHSPRGC